MRPRNVQSESSLIVASAPVAVAPETPVLNRRERRLQRLAQQRLAPQRQVSQRSSRALATGTLLGGSTLLGGALLSTTSAQAAPDAASAPSVRLAQANVYRRAENGPIVTLLQPGYASTLQGKAKILVGIQSRTYAAKTIELLVDGQVSSEPIELDSAPSIEFNWDTTLFPDGPHRLTVRVTDVQGFIGQAETQVYINNGRQRDTAAPVLDWLNINDGDVLKGKKKLQLKASDNFGIKYIFVSINPAGTPNRKPPLRQYLVNHPPYSLEFDTTAVPDGLYVIDALAWDALENEGRAEQRRFGVLNNSMNATLMGEIQKFAPQPGNAMRTSEPRVATNTVPAATTDTNPQAASSNSARNGGTAASGGSTAAGTSHSGGAHIADMPSAPSNNALAAGSVASEAPRLATAPGSPTRTTQSQTASGEAPAAARRSASADALASRNAANQRVAVVAREQNEALRSTLPPVAVPSTKASPATTRLAAKPTATVPVTSTPVASAMPVKKETVPVAARTAPAPMRSASNVVRPTVPQASVAPAKTERVFVTKAPVLAKAPAAALPAFPSANMPLGSMAPSLSGETRIAGIASPVITRSNPARRGDVMPELIGNHETEPPVASLPATALNTPGTSPRFAPLSPSASSMSKRTPAAQRPASAPRATSPKEVASTRVAAMPSQAQGEMHGKRTAITVVPSRSARTLPSSYVAPQEEYLSEVAKRFGLSAEMVATVNHIPVQTRLTRGQQILLPREIAVNVNGSTVSGDVASLLVGSTSVTAFRFLFEQQGGKLIWDATRRQVTARNGEQEITLTIGSKSALVNQEEVMMDMAAFLLSGRTMVPVRFFEKTMRAQVEWEPSTGRLYVSVSNPGALG
jgi:hypothetical protein